MVRFDWLFSCVDVLGYIQFKKVYLVIYILGRIYTISRPSTALSHFFNYHDITTIIPLTVSI